MKAIASTQISFGLINLPVAIVKATGELEDVSFKLGDKSGGSLTQQYVDGNNNVVARSDMTKTIDGHIIDTDSIEAIAAATKLPRLEITKMEPREKFDAAAYRITGFYYLQSPKKGGNVNTFKLLTDAMKAEDMVAVTKFTFRSRQQQIVIWPNDEGMLCASTMVFNGDVREPDADVRAHLAGNYKPAEFDMARQLISAMATDTVDPLSADTDEAVTMRHELVQKALAGEAIPAPTKVPQADQNAALADALAASLAAIKGGDKAAA
mgnify:CR=1 FL=1